MGIDGRRGEGTAGQAPRADAGAAAPPATPAASGLARGSARDDGPAGRELSVLHVVTSSQRRGAEVFAVGLAGALGARGLPGEVVALRPAPSGPELAVDVLTGGGGRGGRRGAGVGLGLRALRRRASGADVVVAHGSRTLDACALALAGTGTPFVYRSIGDPAAWSATGRRRWRTALLLRRAAHVTVLWPGAAAALAELHGVPAGKVSVVPNGVPPGDHPVPTAAQRAAARRRLGLPAEAPVVACIGALGPEKRVAAAVDAVAGLEGVHLLVAGDGPERPALEAHAAERAPGRVVFAGVLPGAGEALAACDAVVLASRTEGMPGVLIEAGLAARPCVATAVGGVGEVVEDGVTGLLVPGGREPPSPPARMAPPERPAGPVEPADLPPGRAHDPLPDRLAEALRRLLDDRAAAAAMGEAARHRCVERFSLDVVADQWADVLRAVATRG